MLSDNIFEVQRLYPQIYLACHVDHVRTSSTSWNLSSRDASILGHLELHKGVGPKVLGAHLGVVPSTFSATLKRLVGLGYISTVPVKEDKRKIEIWLTKRGAEAMASTSILNASRVKQLLKHLTVKERETAIGGLELLAGAARKLREGKN